MPELEAGEARLTVGEARRSALAALRDAGVDNPGIDVRRLLAAALKLPEAQILARPELALRPESARRFAAFIARRQRREPVSRILGVREFYGRSFAVSPATLDPRPDSETLIAATLALVAEEAWSTRPLRLIDVGTGTGCLLLSLLCELGQASGLGTDLSPEALAVARGNAVHLGVLERATWQATDLLENVAAGFHILISNPPYLPSAEIATLEPEVQWFDPHLALDGGGDGLQIFRRLRSRVAEVVVDGWIVLEVGHDQADAVAALFEPLAGGRPEGLRIYRDVSGRRRCVAVRTRN
jgi:release factor glutamine methyltransferase